MIHDLLKQIAGEMSRQRLQPPCSAGDLKNLMQRSTKILDYRIPDGYENFLAITNGLVWNGLTIYASQRTALAGIPEAFVQGFVQANTEYRTIRQGDPMEEFIIFGEDSVAFFAFHVTNEIYEVVSIVGMSILESYATFD